MITEKLIKDIVTGFYYHWHNAPGVNTYQGFDDWWKLNRERFGFRNSMRKGEVCQVNADCKHYQFTEDVNGDVCLTFCNNPKNEGNHEGNTTEELCPLFPEPSK